MCHVLFIASSAPIPQIAATTPATISVEAIAENDAVHGRFPTDWCVRFIGAHTGCSCGFHSQPTWVDDQSGPPNDLADETASRGRLAAIVADLSAGGPIQLHGCWSGDEAIPAVAVKTVPPAWLGRARSPIPDGYSLLIDPTAPCPEDEDAWMDVPPINGIIG